MIGPFLSNNDLTIRQHQSVRKFRLLKIEGGGVTTIFSELKIADFPGLYVASLMEGLMR